MLAPAITIATSRLAKDVIRKLLGVVLGSLREDVLRFGRRTPAENLKPELCTAHSLVQVT